MEKEDTFAKRFAQKLNGIGRILETPDYYVWGCAPIYDDSGALHVLYCRWPAHTGMGGWLKESEIAHATADNPGGPYYRTGSVLQGGDAADWDQSAYNPNIQKINGLYVLTYSGRRRDDPSVTQQIGMATATDPAGPWTKFNKNPVISPSGEQGAWNALHASNPSLVECPDGTYRIYYKGISDIPADPLRTIGVALSDNLFGPYRDYVGNPLITYITKGGDVEDPYAFHYKNSFYLILEDRMGVARNNYGIDTAGDVVNTEGGVRPGLLYSSRNGFSWSDPEIGYHTNDHYFSEPKQRFERPQILWKNRKPEYLFLALKGGRYGLSSGAVLRIHP
jgi:hypothetical protein